MTNPNNLDALSKLVGNKLGQDPQAIKSAAQKQNIDQILSGLSEQDKQKLQSVLSDKTAMNRILATPQAKALLQKFMQGK